MYADRQYKGEDYILEIDLLFKGIIAFVGLIDASVIVNGLILFLISGSLVGIWCYHSKIGELFKTNKKEFTIFPITKIPIIEKQAGIQMHSARAFELLDEIDAHTRILQSTDLTEDQRSQIMNGWKSARMEYDKLVYS